MAQTALPKTKREWRQSYLNFTPPGVLTPIWYRILRDTDDASREISWEENDTTNVWGEDTSDNRQSGQSLSIDPFDTREGDPLTLWLYDADEKQADLDDIAMMYGEVVLNVETQEILQCFMRPCRVLYTAAGGSSAGADRYTVTVKLIGKNIPADFDVATGAFTERTEP
jgi:hypothetical protein